MKLGIIREGKTPPDERVPLSPQQCAEINEKYPDLELVVQKSNVRRFKDAEYTNLGVSIVDNVNDCDVLMGVKEVPINELIVNKKYSVVENMWYNILKIGLSLIILNRNCHLL